MVPNKRGASLFFYCPKCGFEEDVSAVVEPGRTPVLRPIEVRCPRCGGALTVRRSHNLTFTYCRGCSYITAAYSPPEVRLPVERRVLVSWLRNAMDKAAQNKVVIGDGKFVRVDRMGWGNVDVLILHASIKRVYAESLRPLDSVFYANELAIVLEELKVKKCSDEICEGYLRLAAKPKQHPRDGSLHLAEPTMLYESALRILEENKMHIARGSGGGSSV